MKTQILNLVEKTIKHTSISAVDSISFNRCYEGEKMSQELKNAILSKKTEK